MKQVTATLACAGVICGVSVALVRGCGNRPGGLSWHQLRNQKMGFAASFCI